MADVDFATDQLDSALDAYLVHMYGGDVPLSHIIRKTLIEEHRWMANALLNLREARSFPSPNVIGAERCASCNMIMGEDEPSAAEDETICQACGGDLGDAATPETKGG